jgi:hypothetical protein
VGAATTGITTQQGFVSAGSQVGQHRIISRPVERVVAGSAALQGMATLPVPQPQPQQTQTRTITTPPPQTTVMQGPPPSLVQQGQPTALQAPPQVIQGPPLIQQAPPTVIKQGPPPQTAGQTIVSQPVGGQQIVGQPQQLLGGQFMQSRNTLSKNQ